MKIENIKLIEAPGDYAQEFVAALREGFSSGSSDRWDEAKIVAVAADFNQWWIERNDISTPIELSDGRLVPKVPQVNYWLVDEAAKRFLGEIGLRLELTEHLKKTGGHIGYSIRPNERKKGYGSLMLQKLLPLAKQKHGLTEVLITCDDDNIGSAKIIEKNGGVLENIVVNELGKAKRRYWIKL